MEGIDTTLFDTGSSPREWGTPRLYPAECRLFSVHPHASGEHCFSVTESQLRFGSSPREWGTLAINVLLCCIGRFIPTRVGNTASHSWRQIWGTVHPHASGEHALATNAGASDNGSSPREWGTQVQRRSGTVRERFIPTRVGNTAVLLPSAAAVPVHPHASGEHVERGRGHHVEYGSSPREWGTHRGARDKHTQDRFIPTRVGNTACFSGGY